MAKIKANEKDVQASCHAYLQAKKYFFFRLNNAPIFDPKLGFYRKMAADTPKGLPDDVLIREGKFVGLEYKGSDGSLSEDQVECHKRIIKAGGEVYVIRSIDDLEKIGL